VPAQLNFLLQSHRRRISIFELAETTAFPIVSLTPCFSGVLVANPTWKPLKRLAGHGFMSHQLKQDVNESQFNLHKR
jgi:hypothetical protein